MFGGNPSPRIRPTTISTTTTRIRKRTVLAMPFRTPRPMFLPQRRNAIMTRPFPNG
jgi:hypothetical protein